jgi:hypothetical protein
MLALSLGVVFALDRPPRPAAPPPPPPVIVKLPPKIPKLAVVKPPKQYDDMGSLLARLGKGYPYTELHLEDLEQPGKLDGFEIVFLTCGTVPDSWTDRVIGDGVRENTRNVTWKRDVRERVVSTLRAFVSGGGTLYASDWALTLITATFQEHIERNLIGPQAEGAAQDIEATVADDGLRRSIGDIVKLHFDQPEWRPAPFRGRNVTVYLQGKYRSCVDNRMLDAPLLVKFREGKGAVIFTSFHNEKVNSDAEQKLLQHLVFSAITENLVTAAYETILTGALSHDSASILSAKAGKSSETAVYRVAQSGPFRLALLFNPGAHLKLVLKPPAGGETAPHNPVEVSKEGVQSFELEIPDARPGDWTCVVFAVDVPFENFPFRLAVRTR